MALPWKLILTNVPWKDVLNQAPKIADGAKKMWGSMGRKPGAGPESSAMAETTVADGDLPTRLAALEIANHRLQTQMLASGELIQALSQQNAQLVAQIETHRRRAQRQAWVLAVTALAAGLALLLTWQPHLLEFFA